MTPASERKPVQALWLDLPMPISTNALYMPVAHGRRVATIKTVAYRNWIIEAGYKLNSQPKERIIGPYGLYLYVSSKSRADLDNCLKSCSDILQAHGIVENDRHCMSIKAEWSSSIEGMRVMLAQSASKAEAA